MVERRDHVGTRSCALGAATPQPEGWFHPGSLGATLLHTALQAYLAALHTRRTARSLLSFV